MRRLAADLALPETQRSRRSFDRAARSFASACFIHDEARRRLLERVDDLKLQPKLVVDLGCALGRSASELKNRFAEAQVLALDSSREMLKYAAVDRVHRAAADAAQLPFADRTVDLIFANLVLPWTRPASVFAEARRVLTADGAMVFATLGPDSLSELRRAWIQADDSIHVHGFFDMQTLGDLAVSAGLEEPVLDVDRVRVSYSELSAAIRDLRACGATNAAAGRRRGLTGRGRWQRFVEALWRDQGEGRTGRLSLTVELIFGQAFGARARAQIGGDPTEISVPLSSIGRRR